MQTDLLMAVLILTHFTLLRYNEKKDKMEAARVAQIFADEDVGNTSEAQRARHVNSNGQGIRTDVFQESTEDENADLLTQRVESKIFDTLTKIKAGVRDTCPT